MSVKKTFHALCLLNLCILFLLAGDYPSEQNISTGSIDCSVPFGDSCFNVGSDSVFRVSHDANGNEKAEHFNAIPGPMLSYPANTQNVGSSSNYWSSGFITSAYVSSLYSKNASTQLAIQADGRSDVSFFKTDPNGQNYIYIYGPASTANLWLAANSTGGFIGTTVGKPLVFQSAGTGDAYFFINDNNEPNTPRQIRAYDGDSNQNEFVALSHDGSYGILSGSTNSLGLRIDSNLFFGGASRTIRTLAASGFDLSFADTRTPVLALSKNDPNSTRDTAWSANLPAAQQAIFNALNYLADNISGAATLQGAYNNGPTIATSAAGSLDINVTNNPIKISGATGTGNAYVRMLGSNAGDTGLKLTWNSTYKWANASTPDPNSSVVLESGGVSRFFVHSDNATIGAKASLCTGATVPPTGCVYLRTLAATSDASYQAEISTDASRSLLVSGASNTKLTSGASTYINAGGSTYIDSAATTTYIGARGALTGVVQIGLDNNDTDMLRVRGTLSLVAGRSSGSGTWPGGVTSIDLTCAVCSNGSTTHMIYVMPTGNAPAGRWWITWPSPLTGGFRINSTSTEASNVGYSWVAIGK